MSNENEQLQAKVVKAKIVTQQLMITKMPNLKNHWIDELGTFHALFRFDNNFGASVISGQYSYGGPELFELAVIY